MRVIGLVGGIASGKSSVADMFRQLGAKVIQADQIGHEVLGEPDVAEALRRRWGSRILDARGGIDRRAVAGIVFAPPPGDPRELRFLESITHPRIAERMRKQISDFNQAGDVPAVVLDAAMLLEAGWEPLVDKIVFVDAEREHRLQRAYRRGWTGEDFMAREAAQLSLQEKRKLADWVIDNAQSFDHTFAQVQQFWHSLDLPPPD